MVNLIPYSLTGDSSTSDRYYHDVKALVDEWLPAATGAMADIIAGFRQYRKDLGHRDRTDAECTFELLVLGVMLREHGSEAERWPGWATRSIEFVEHMASLEPVSKQLRGYLGHLARLAQSTVKTESARQADAPRSMDLDRLSEWMRAHGQAKRADRVNEWRDYLTPVASATSQRALVMIMALADDFARASYNALGRYTEGVARFRAIAQRKYANRYDEEMVTRTPLEYHLGMVGTEILNRVNREKFQSTRRRVVILPPCMRARPDDECKATPTDLGAKCQSCTVGCHVNQITKLGEKRGFEVYMIPDEMHRVGAASAQTEGGIGLVGVSCALTNWSGGWDTDELGVPAQGVLLDYAGCKYHWDDEGIETSVNLHQIEAIATVPQLEDAA